MSNLSFHLNFTAIVKAAFKQRMCRTITTIKWSFICTGYKRYICVTDECPQRLSFWKTTKVLVIAEWRQSRLLSEELVVDWEGFAVNVNSNLYNILLIILSVSLDILEKLICLLMAKSHLEKLLFMFYLRVLLIIRLRLFRKNKFDMVGWADVITMVLFLNFK